MTIMCAPSRVPCAHICVRRIPKTVTFTPTLLSVVGTGVLTCPSFFKECGFSSGNHTVLRITAVQQLAIFHLTQDWRPLAELINEHVFSYLGFSQPCELAIHKLAVFACWPPLKCWPALMCLPPHKCWPPHKCLDESTKIFLCPSALLETSNLASILSCTM